MCFGRGLSDPSLSRFIGDAARGFTLNDDGVVFFSCPSLGTNCVTGLAADGGDCTFASGGVVVAAAVLAVCGGDAAPDVEMFDDVELPPSFARRFARIYNRCQRLLDLLQSNSTLAHLICIRLCGVCHGQQ